MFSFREQYHQEEKRAIDCSRAENQGRCWQWIDILAALKDADTLRSDPMLKTVCDQLPESDPDLATQPTFSRLENSVTKKDLMRLSRWLLRCYVRSLKKRRPSKIILDLDSTDDHTHGQQEFSFYHGYYRNHILHPLLIFDADTGDLVCAVLRPGNKGAASHIGPILKRVVEAIRQAVGTDVEIEIRADSGFATPRLYEFCECEENKLQYVIGLSRNPRLQRVVEPLLDSTRERFLELEEKQRQFDEFLYRAHSWDRSRRVIVKVEVDQRGINRRFVVTNRDDLCSQSLYDHYTNRGQTENFIKAFKKSLSVADPFVCRCLTSSSMLRFHIPLVGRVESWRGSHLRPRFQLPPRQTQHADFPHCAFLSASRKGL